MMMMMLLLLLLLLHETNCLVHFIASDPELRSWLRYSPVQSSLAARLPAPASWSLVEACVLTDSQIREKASTWEHF